MSNEITKWSIMTRIFHWGTVILLFVTWLMISLDGNINSTLDFLDLHKAFGTTVLLFVAARILNRLSSQAPPAVPMPKWQHQISHITHWSLYLLLLAMPIAGILTSLYGNHPISMFGLFDIPVMITPDRKTAHLFENIHKDILWVALLIMTGLHVVGALYHQFIQKDNLIARMR